MFDLEKTLQILNALERDGVPMERMCHLRPDVGRLLAAKNQRRQIEFLGRKFDADGKTGQDAQRPHPTAAQTGHW
jgi:hypothetical protein